LLLARKKGITEMFRHNRSMLRAFGKRIANSLMTRDELSILRRGEKRGQSSLFTLFRFSCANELDSEIGLPFTTRRAIHF
jgi:hypothetical protein